MKKVFFTRGLMALALAATMTACHSEQDYQQPTEAEAVTIAEKALGVTIDPDQSWNMTQDVTASISVYGDYDTSNEVTVYANNPLIDNTGTVLRKGKVKSGSTLTLELTVPKSNNMVYIGVKDYKGYTYVQPAGIIDGKVEAIFGDGSSNAPAMAPRRSATNSYVNIPEGTDPSEYAATIAAKSLVEVNNTNASYNNADYYTIEYGYEQGTGKQYVIFEGIKHNDDYVINYLISQNYSGTISALGNAGKEVVGTRDINWFPYKEAVYQNVPRTVYITGTWTIPTGQYQTCGQGSLENAADGVIIVGNGGTLEVNGTLNMVNQARLIVLEGGSVTGTGTINVTNGSTAGQESYNYGTISVKQLNENFGNFFNFGTITSETLVGGAGTSCFVNHGTINIKEAYGNNSTPANLQIKNNCNFIASNTVACKIIENGADAFLQCGELRMSAGEGGEGLGSYMALDSGSRLYVKESTSGNITTGDFYGNNMSIAGPTSGNYAYICVEGRVAQWVWSSYSGNPSTQHPGMLINHVNCYVAQGFANLDTEYNWNIMMNEAVLDTNVWTNWGSKIGIGGFTMLTTKDGFNTAQTEDSDCAPGFTPSEEIIVIEETPEIYSYAFEDSRDCDYDLNDVVIKAYEDNNNIVLKLVASGATLDLQIRLYTNAGEDGLSYGDSYTILRDTYGKSEVHDMFNVDKGIMVNTEAGARGATQSPVEFYFLKEGYDYSKLRLAIWVPSHEEEIRLSEGGLAWGTGNAPYGVRIPGDWKWPKEFINVIYAYPDFATFASDASDATGQTWYKNSNIVTSKVMDESSLGY